MRLLLLLPPQTWIYLAVLFIPSDEEGSYRQELGKNLLATLRWIPGADIFQAMSDTSPRLKIVYCPSPFNEATVDVIAVPGIGAPPDNTWKYRDAEGNGGAAGCDWLKSPDMLPAAAPKARIMKFAYESQWIGTKSVVQRGPSVADQLLHAIKGQRKDCPKRPIVFVAHCFGGIIIEHAIITAKLEGAARSESSKGNPEDITNCVAGILFLGTPFKGSKSQRYAEKLGKGLSWFGLGDPHLMESIAPGNDALRTLLRNFVAIVNAESIPIFCFYELRPTNTWRIFGYKNFGRKEIVVDIDSATIGYTNNLPLEKDHFGLNKFQSRSDQGCEEVLQVLQEMIEAAPSKVQARLNPRPLNTARSDQDLSNLRLDSLATFCHQNPLDQILRGPKIDQTLCHPLTAEPVLKDWLNNDEDSHLWVLGWSEPPDGPMVKSLIHALASRVEKSSKLRALAYIPYDSRSQSGTSAIFVLRCLIRQVLEQRMGSVGVVLQEYERDRDTFFTRPHALERLWNIFERILTDSELITVYIVFDYPMQHDLTSLDDIFPLLKSRSGRKCRIKSLTIGDNIATFKKHFEKYRCINLQDTSVTSEAVPTPSLGPKINGITPGSLLEAGQRNSSSASIRADERPNSPLIGRPGGTQYYQRPSSLPGVPQPTLLEPLRHNTGPSQIVVATPFPFIENFLGPLNPPTLRAPKCNFSLPLNSTVDYGASRQGPPAAENLAKVSALSSDGAHVQASSDCEIELLPGTSSNHFMILARGILDDAEFMRVQLSKHAPPIPHTETFLRKNTVSIWGQHKTTLSQGQNRIDSPLPPRFTFLDESEFKSFQESILGLQLPDCRLRFIRVVKLIESDRDKECSRQDLRIWSTSNGENDLFLMFYANARKKSQTGYYMERATSFVTVDRSSQSATHPKLQLRFRTKSLADLSSAESSVVIGTYPDGKRLNSLAVEFLSMRDRSDFLHKWSNELLVEAKGGL